MKHNDPHHRVPMLRVLGFYALVFLTYSGILLILFHTVLLQEERTLFYRGLGLLGIATIITAALVYLAWHITRVVVAETAVASLILAISVHISILVVFPVTFDRSVTMFMLNSINQKTIRINSECDGKSREELKNEMIEEYVIKQDAIGRRVNEQKTIGTIKPVDSCVSLTPKGKWFLEFSQFVKILYNIK